MRSGGNKILLLCAWTLAGWAAATSIAAAQSVSAPTGDAYDRPDAQTIRQTAQEILAGAEFQEDKSALSFRRLLEKIAEAIGAILPTLRAVGPIVGAFFVVVLIAGLLLMLALLGLLIFRLFATWRRGVNVSPQEAAPHFRSLRTRSYEQLCQMMRELTAQGKVRQAVGVLMAALLCWLDARKIVQWDDSKTHGDYVREFALPGARPDFRRFVGAVESRVYAGLACSRDDVETLWKAMETLQRHVSQGT